jgi:AraC family transcriptional regulator
MAQALGPPEALHAIHECGRLVAAIGRWRHNGACVDINSADAFRLVFNVSGGQVVEIKSRERSLRTSISEGSIGIVGPDTPARVSVTGRADILQIILSQALVTGVPETVFLPQTYTRDRQIQAAAAQALVALTREADGVQLNAIVQRVAVRLGRSASSSRPRQGGLSPGAKRRVEALIEERTQSSSNLISLSELASAAGLSIHHFTRAFRRTEGETPYARVISRRVDHALTLLLKTDARVDSISDVTGFSSASHFVSCFRERMGVTPGALRNAVHSRWQRAHSRSSKRAIS